MNLGHSNWTGRPSRTIEDAFGPHASRRITVPQDPMPRADKIVLVFSILAVIALICFVALGWLPGTDQ